MTFFLTRFVLQNVSDTLDRKGICAGITTHNLQQVSDTQTDQRGLTVEAETNGDSKSTNEGGPSLVGSLCSSCRYKRFYPAMAALVKILLSYTVHYFNSFVPIAQQAGQAGSPVSYCVSLPMP